MKFTESSASLLQALNTISGAVPSKSTLPVLECILFERDGDQLKLSATDLNISMRRYLPVQFESNGTGEADRIAVPARRLIDTLRALPDIPVQFSSDEDFRIVLTTDQGQYQMMGFDPADYPKIPEASADTELEIEGEVLKQGIHKTSFAVSRDELRPAMMGVFFHIRPEEGRMVATDGHRLVRLAMKALHFPEELEFIVPEKALSLLARVLEEEPVRLTVAENFVVFRTGDTEVISRLIGESYPNYEAVIPLDNDRKLVINRKAMLAAVKRVALYSSSTTHQVRLSLRPDEVEISAEDIERASAARERVLAEFDGEPMDIGFNAVYLSEVLGHIDTEDVQFEFSSPNRASVVRPVDSAPDEDVLMLIMPVMLNTYV